jgi:glycosyltransferase involved in cell wall biosynthesis
LLLKEKNKLKALFLYTEIADYFLASCNALIQKGVEVHVVRWPVNKEAPFQFVYPDGMNVYERTNFDDDALLELVQKINPSIIICSGWVDKGYLKICKKYKQKINTVLTLDNHWRGDLKQRIAAFISPFYLKSRFSKCWVPGSLQFEYARKLGFKKKQIETGFYSCDFDLFFNQYLTNKEHKQKCFPKRFIFVGRYYEFKGIKDLWIAFIDLQKESLSDWELWCLGTGDIEPVKHDKIKHFGFVQPKDLPKYIKETGVFVLPSRFEPWGVVIHEFAAAGFPIVCSDEVGARIAFLENDVNGYIYQAGNIQQLKDCLKKMMSLKEEVLLAMGQKSVDKAKLNTPEIWADKLMRMISS